MTATELKTELERAFDFRGDVQITLLDGAVVEGYLFDRHAGATLDDSYIRILPANGSPKRKIAFTQVAAVAFSGRDMAAGKSWEAWVRKYNEKKAAGETNIGLMPEELD